MGNWGQGVVLGMSKGGVEAVINTSGDLSIELKPLIGQMITTQVKVGASVSVPLPASPLSTRQAIAFYNTASGDLYIGNSGVTRANGYVITGGTDISIDTRAEFYGIMGIGTSGDVRVIEVA